MQSSEDCRTGARMPSLLTPAQQAEADRNRILTKLEHGKAHAQPVQSRSRTLAWSATGAIALALIGGAAFWMSGDRQAAPQAAAVLAAASVAPTRAEPLAARGAEPEPAPAEPAPAEPASAAAIHDEPASPAAASRAPPAAEAAKPAPDDLRNALEEDSTAEKTPVHKSTSSSAKATPKAAPKAAPRTNPARLAPDNDVALLSALVAHTQAASAASDSTRALRNELKACSRLKGNKARDCREEACLGQERSVAACR